MWLVSQASQAPLWKTSRPMSLKSGLLTQMIVQTSGRKLWLLFTQPWGVTRGKSLNVGYILNNPDLSIFHLKGSLKSWIYFVFSLGTPWLTLLGLSCSAFFVSITSLGTLLVSKYVNKLLKYGFIWLSQLSIPKTDVSGTLHFLDQTFGNFGGGCLDTETFNYLWGGWDLSGIRKSDSVFQFHSPKWQQKIYICYTTPHLKYLIILVWDWKWNLQI